jgi:hypothetical protein
VCLLLDTAAMPVCDWNAVGKLGGTVVLPVMSHGCVLTSDTHTDTHTHTHTHTHTLGK